MNSDIKVLFLKDSQWGKRAEIKSINAHFFKNVLEKQGIAKLADSQTLNIAKQKEEKKERDHEKSLESVKKLIENLILADGIVFERQVTLTGKLYAKVDEKDIMKELLMKHKIKLDKSNIALKNKIEEVGEYSFEIVFEKLREKIILKIIAQK